MVKLGCVNNIPGSFAFLYGVINEREATGAVGSGGKLYIYGSSIDDEQPSWRSEQVAGVTTQLNSIASNGLDYAVIVGQLGSIFTLAPNSDWIKVKSNTTSDLNSITHGEPHNVSQLVAVGEAFANKTAILTSIDGGLNWLAFNNSFNVNLYAVTYGNGQYVAVGSNGTIITSSDGNNWTRQSGSPVSDTLRGIVYGNRQYVAVGNAGTVITSLNGTNWIKQSSPVSKNLTGVVLRWYSIYCGWAGWGYYNLCRWNKLATKKQWSGGKFKCDC